MMRAGYDAAAKWPAFPDWARAELRREGWTARPVAGLHQALVSGDLDAARSALEREATEAGLWAVASGPTVFARAARDRALIVSAAPLPLDPGWHAAGFAFSPAESGFAVCDIEGPAMPDVVREAVSADLEARSPAAATLFAGLPCLLYRAGEDRARLHLETGLLPALWHWLEGRGA